MSTDTQPNTESNATQSHPPKSGGSGIVTGLLVTSVVVGSCVGLAAYVDYRLNTVEEMFANRSTEVLASIDKSSDALKAEVNDKSSILAKGILELTNKEEERHTLAMNSFQEQQALLKSNQSKTEDTVNSAVASAAKDMETLLTNQSKDSEKAIQALLARSDKAQADKLDAVASVVKSIQSSHKDQNKSLLAAIQTVNTDLEKTRASISSHVKQTEESIAQLIQLANEDQKGKLSELASAIDTVSSNDSSADVKSSITKLALQIDAIQKNISSTDSAVYELSQMVPAWKQGSDTQIRDLISSAGTLETQLKEQMDAVQQKVSSMGQALEETTDSILRAMYDNSQGVEGARVDLKSRIATHQEETTTHLEQLVESVQGLSDELKSVNESAKSTSFAIPTSYKEANAYHSNLVEVSDAFRALRETLDEELSLVLSQNSADATDEEVAKVLEQLMGTVSTLSDEIGGQLEMLQVGFKSLSETSTLLSEMDGADATVVEASDSSAHPEQRSDEQLGFTLQ